MSTNDLYDDMNYGLNRANLVMIELSELLSSTEFDDDEQKLLFLLNKFKNSIDIMENSCKCAIQDLEASLKKKCEHNFVVDSSYFDPCKSIKVCTKCKEVSY